MEKRSTIGVVSHGVARPVRGVYPKPDSSAGRGTEKKLRLERKEPRPPPQVETDTVSAHGVTSEPGRAPFFATF